jgi:predicted amidohydrolase YtcJ
LLILLFIFIQKNVSLVYMEISHQDLILINANIITLDPFSPQASWVAIKNDKIVTTGHGKDWKNFKHKNTSIIDCSGKTVLPGLIDSHFHLVSYAKSFVTSDLSPGKNVHSISDIQSIIKNCSRNRPSGQWIFGRGYNEFYLAEKRHPNRWDLDKAIAGHPVRLTHRSGHVHILNSLALKLVGITRETGDPDGGIIERDLKTGEPTGLLYEMGDFLSDQIPALASAELEKGVQTANQKLISMGITSIQDASSRNDSDNWEGFKSWKKSGMLQPRVNMMLGFQTFEKNGHLLLSTNLNENQLRFNAVKIILDDTTGRLHPAQTELNRQVHAIHKAGLQAAIHALEEKAIAAACEAIQFALEKSPAKDHRHRIEHCSVCSPDLARKILSLGITVVTQPAFIYFHGERYLDTVPDEQLKHLYPIRTLLDQGINVAASSDCPIVSPDPLIGINAAMHRLSATGDIVGGREKIQSSAALQMYTLNAARATFEEAIKGTISAGKLADLVILNADPTRLTADEFKNLQIDKTIIGGQVVWEKKR